VNDFDRQRYQRLHDIATEIISEHTDLGTEFLTGLFNSQKGYATPRVDVRAAVFQDDRLLMVRERSDGRWTLPGGWADVGDIPSYAAEREVWEEAGLQVKARRVIGIYDANRFRPLDLFHAYKVFFLCDLLGGKPGPSSETTEVAFFNRQEIPVDLSGERTQPRHIEHVFKAWENPNLPTFFD
jgi:ADP-ribose pyrophosphatase YjhB (NUDIX family)